MLTPLTSRRPRPRLLLAHLFKEWGLLHSALLSLSSVGFPAGLVRAATQPPVTETAVVRVVSATASADEIRYSMGSGFFVNDTHIVTNEHLGSPAGSSSELLVVFPDRDTLEAVKLVWSNPELDLAVLGYTGGTPRGVLALAAADPSRGAEVFALGYPGPADTGSLGGAASSTLTEGILSREPFRAQWGSGGTALARVLQHTAAINPGSSGGPLVNACGAVVGVNTSGAPSELRDADGDLIGTTAAQGIFFALAVSELRAELQRRGVDFSNAEECEPDARAAPFSSFVIALFLVALLATGAWLVGRRARRVASEEPGRTPPVAVGGSQPPPARHDDSRSVHDATVPPPAPAWFAGRSGTPDLSVRVAELKGARHGVSVGRNPRLVDRALSDPTLSRRHFRLSLDNDRLFVEDLGSTHGTFVNGQRLKPYHARRLEDGDTVRAGRGEWRFTATGSVWN